MRHRTATAILATALLTLTACSSSADSTDAAPPAAGSGASAPAATAFSAPPVDDGSATLEIVVTAYTDAYFAGDSVVAWLLLSTRCQGRTTPEAYSAVVERAAADYGPDHPATDVEAEVSGDLARVSYRVSGLPELDQEAQPWTREGGVWKYDAC